MAHCNTCGRETLRIRLVAGNCLKCIEASAAQKAQERGGEVEIQHASERSALAAAASEIILTTETAHDLPIDRRLDIVSAEVVIGMHLFKDIASAFRDTFGGRSRSMQDGLREARRDALNELRMEAMALGAHAVVGVDLDYSEISGGGKSMLFLVASGTAVTLKHCGGDMRHTHTL